MRVNASELLSLRVSGWTLLNASELEGLIVLVRLGVELMMYRLRLSTTS